MPDAAAPPAWRVRERTARRADLLDAARAEFAAHGYAGATVEGIAARAEVGKGTVYLHFAGGKAGLLQAVLDDHLRALQALVVEAFTCSEGPARYRFWVLALSAASYFRRQPDLLRIHARELPRLLASGEGGEAAARLGRLTNELVGVVAPALGGGGVPSAVAAHHLLATLFGHLTTLGLQPDTEAGALALDADPPAVADALTALVFDGIAVRP
ncbi:TetR/AcrR family transcriptional regulator [Rubrivirga litoralis]|uniref:TetR/AcrR family transcriptional regulator n=1 Tax=Rubrivirga litoralis TaxID=3075598 RepID=A0ABU3BRK9_9BACT|nr:TetR/AcrR family transcriptional regulator [Rubrivirga sp. F394]MDT0631934.1 TetR/AcrR family transcriptional regulator [Rubrivirga sp. F394]